MTNQSQYLNKVFRDFIKGTKIKVIHETEKAVYWQYLGSPPILKGRSNNGNVHCSPKSVIDDRYEEVKDV